ncbi:hypothetical protein BDN67DRAFT_557565 [Paxillus ammoniavirescens]|nr:hypothetical protein BDN67DRAFT_557565 [Paxillus ammoniavirescens]
MQIIQPVVFLVCASYAFATTCAVCAHEIGDLPFLQKCYKTASAANANKATTLCTYEENFGITGVDCTYDERGMFIGSDSVGECTKKVPVNSKDCPPCFT